MVLATLVSRVAVPPFHPSKTFLVIARSNPGSFPCLCVCLLCIPGVTKQELNLLYFASWYLEASCSLWATPFPRHLYLALSLSFFLSLSTYTHKHNRCKCTRTYVASLLWTISNIPSRQGV